MTDIILKKRNGLELSDEEIGYFVTGAARDEIPDYQLSALLMAIFLNGMTQRESFALTYEMAKSGDTLDLSAVNGETVDKHSTGGVGDKTTLIAAPIAAALGCKVAKLSGRGLSHTGGTIDKLESISGFNANPSPRHFIEQVNEIGLCIAGQSGDLAPADKRLYALRDVTCTVDSLPLVASSVMSKKLAASAKNIVLDVKTGKGAFMKDKASACALAEMMAAIGKKAGLRVRALVTDMDSPLGNAVGNSLEVIEAADVLKGRGPSGLTALCVVLSANMHSLCFGCEIEESKKLVLKAIENGSGFDKLCQMVSAQGGDVRQLENTGLLPVNPCGTDVVSQREGYITQIDSQKIGRASVIAGAGRETKTDKIDYSAGIMLRTGVGEYVKKGDVLATIYGEKQLLETAKTVLMQAYGFGGEKPAEKPLIIDCFE